MPVYDYRCTECKCEFTQIHKIADMKKPCEEACPNEECGAEGTVEKFIPVPPPIVDPLVAGRIRMNEDNRWRLNEIRKNHEGKGTISTTDDMFGNLLDQ